MKDRRGPRVVRRIVELFELSDETDCQEMLAEMVNLR